ncbi:hypothetical protein [Sulfitobacter sp. R18_1]|uniref:hypothetical protein n=1 Tax=Sulfitobacter sp. R18_1 TaxID=2821104 RepID=UPI001ADB2344|nr:hypothetical protein [Sulfitobacter sp. R18_1]MBO9427927.1 hypothetical protein [Sulfitobacter sp. R18_1]
MPLEDMTWGQLQDDASLLHCMEPEQAHDYLARKVFMDFDATKGKAHDKSLDEFRDKTLIPAIFAVASLYVPELRSDVELRNKALPEIWKTVMYQLVLSDDLPALDDPERDKKALLMMTDMIKDMVKPSAEVSDEPEAPAPGF